MKCLGLLLALLAPLCAAQSFYVRAEGNDANNGLTAERPFRTLARALEAAKESGVKIITVIGILNGESEGSGGGKNVFSVADSGRELITIQGRPGTGAGLYGPAPVFTVTANVRNAVELLRQPFSPQGHLDRDPERPNSYLETGKRVLAITGSSRILLRNLEISRGLINGPGGGIFVSDGAELVLGNALVRNNAANWGGGVCVEDGSLTVQSGEISGNIAYNMGGGLASFRAALHIEGGKIQGNAASYGGGVFVRNSRSAFVDGEIGGNQASAGGGFLAEFGTTELRGGSIKNNRAFEGGAGLYIMNKSGVRMTGGFIEENHTPGHGGGVYIAGEFVMSGGSLAYNNANGNTSGRGGGVFMEEDSVFIVSGGAKIEQNYAADEGGGVYAGRGSALTITGGAIQGNTARYGGGVYFRGSVFAFSEGYIKKNSASLGGGVFTGAAFIMTGGAIEDNAAYPPENALEGSGGGIFVDGRGSFFLSGGFIIGNKALVGGGLVVYEDASFLMSGGEISGNRGDRAVNGVLCGGTSAVTGGRLNDENRFAKKSE